MLNTTLVCDKVTRGAVRFTETDTAEDRPLSIYLRKAMVEELGLPAEEGVSVTLTIAPTA